VGEDGGDGACADEEGEKAWGLEELVVLLVLSRDGDGLAVVASGLL